MTLHFCVFFCTLLLLTFDLCQAYGNGAPNSKKVCSGLIPGHGNEQSGEAPYKFIYEDNENEQGVLTLEATAQVTFAGFIVQARNENNRENIIDGQFAHGGNSQPKTCFNGKNNTWTHTNGQPKTQVQTIWKPPQFFNGSIVFQGTVVQVKQAFWPKIFSKPIYFLAGDIVDQETYLKYLQDISKESTIDAIAASQSADGLPYDICQNSACLGLAETHDCLKTKTCQMILSVKQSSSENRFLISAMPTEQQLSSKYFSMAFSEDSKMGNDVVVDCFVDSRGTVKMGVSVNVGQNNRLSFNSVHILKDVQVKSVDGIVTCQWSMDSHFQVENHPISLGDKKYFILLATGMIERDDGEKGYHDIRIPTSETVDLASFGSLGSAESKELSYLIKVHGSLMVLSWIGTVSIGIMFARYFKNSWPNTLLGGVKVWFAFHRFLMVLSILMMCIAQACIFYYVGGYKFEQHQIVGSIAFAFALLQPLGALFRPHPDASSRWMFNWGHWFGGNAGQISAVAAILLATNLKVAGLPMLFLNVVLAWIVFHVIVHIILQIHSACSSRTKTADIALHELQNGQAIYIENHSNISGQALRTFILFIYSISTLMFCALLISLVCVPKHILSYF